MTSLRNGVLAVAVVALVVGAFFAGATMFPRIERITTTTTIFTPQTRFTYSPLSGYVVESLYQVSNVKLKTNLTGNHFTDTISFFSPQLTTFTLQFPSYYYRNWVIYQNGIAFPQSMAFWNFTSIYKLGAIAQGNVSIVLESKVV